MAFVYKEKKDPLKIRPATALGPGQYLPITETKFIKVNDDRAPFESQELKFKPLSGTIRTNTPGPGTYYQDVDEVKIQKIIILLKLIFTKFNKINMKMQVEII